VILTGSEGSLPVSIDLMMDMYAFNALDMYAFDALNMYAYYPV